MFYRLRNEGTRADKKEEIASPRNVERIKSRFKTWQLEIEAGLGTRKQEDYDHEMRTCLRGLWKEYI